MMFPVLTSGMLNSVLFGVYGNELRRLNSLCANDAERRREWRQNVFIAGSEAGLIFSLLACPIELIKIRLQTQNCTYYVRPSNRSQSLLNNAFQSITWRFLYYRHQFLFYLLSSAACGRLRRLQKNKTNGTWSHAVHQANLSQRRHLRILSWSGADDLSVSWQLFVACFVRLSTYSQ